MIKGDRGIFNDKALDIVIAAGKASPSMSSASRSESFSELTIGCSRAARLVEELEIRGIVGPANGSKAREVIHVPSKPRE